MMWNVRCGFLGTAAAAARPKARVIAAPAVFAVLMSWAPFVQAATDIQPPFVFMQAARTVEIITVTNDRTIAAGYDVEALGWEQKPNGEILLPPTDGIRVEPSSLEIPPHGRAAITVTALAPVPKDGETEKVFRIRIRERADRPREETEKEIRVIASVTMPVFLQPPQPTARASVEAKPVTEGRLGLAVVNAGTAHTYVREIAATGRDKAGKTVFAINRNGWYVLANGRLEFNAALSGRDCRRSRTITVSARPLEGDEVWETTLSPDAKRCGRGKETEFVIPGLVKMPGGSKPVQAARPHP